MRILRCSATVTMPAIALSLCAHLCLAATADSTHTETDSASCLGKARINHDELLRLPFRTIEEIIGLQDGTTLYYPRPGGEFSLTVPEVSVRGSQPFETGYYLNGVQMNDPYGGYFTARVSPHALEYLTLDPFDQDARHGFSGASAIRMEIRKGGPKYAAMVESITDNALGSGFDQNWYTTSLGGPIPGLRDASIFGLLERRYFGDRNPSIMTDDFLPGHPEQLPGNWLDGWSYNGRLDYAPLDNLNLTATLDGSTTEWSEYIHAYYFDSVHLPYYKDKNLAFSGRAHLQLSPTLEYSMQVSYFKSERFRGDGVWREDLDAYRKPYANHETDAYQLFYDWDDSDGPTTDFDEGHTWDDYLRHKSSRVEIRDALSLEIGQGHKITLGSEHRRYAIRAYQNFVPTNIMGFSDRNVNHFGYDIAGNEDDDGGTDWGNEVRLPDELGVYLAGQLRFGDLELNPGMRLDIFDYNTLRLKDIHRPFGEDMTLDLGDMEPVEAHVRWSPRFAFLYTPEETNLSLSGSLGWYYLPTPYSTIYSSWDFFEARVGAGSYYPHPNPAAEPVKVRNLELGLAYAFGELLDLSLTGFDNETANSLGILYISPAEPFVYNYCSGVSGWKSFGLDVSMILKISDQFTVDFGQTWQSVETDGFGPASTYNIAWKNPAGVSTPWYRADSEQAYSSSITFGLELGKREGPRVFDIYPFEQLTLSLTEETCTGYPYTPVMPYDAVGLKITQQTPTGPINSAFSPANSVFNLMVEREFKTSGFTLTPFLWVRNLFNSVIVYHVYAGTGEPDNTGYLQTAEGIARTDYDLGPYDNSGMKFGERYDFAQHDPLNYGPPRQILFGLRVSF